MAIFDENRASHILQVPTNMEGIACPKFDSPCHKSISPLSLLDTRFYIATIQARALRAQARAANRIWISK